MDNVLGCHVVEEFKHGLKKKCNERNRNFSPLVGNELSECGTFDVLGDKNDAVDMIALIKPFCDVEESDDGCGAKSVCLLYFCSPCWRILVRTNEIGPGNYLAGDVPTELI